MKNIEELFNELQHLGYYDLRYKDLEDGLAVSGLRPRDNKYREVKVRGNLASETLYSVVYQALKLEDGID